MRTEGALVDKASASTQPAEQTGHRESQQQRRDRLRERLAQDAECQPCARAGSSRRKVGHRDRDGTRC
jgi:hypothetical protein